VSAEITAIDDGNGDADCDYDDARDHGAPEDATLLPERQRCLLFFFGPTCSFRLCTSKTAMESAMHPLVHAARSDAVAAYRDQLQVARPRYFAPSWRKRGSTLPMLAELSAVATSIQAIPSALLW
jgi:hypothetical protein